MFFRWRNCLTYVWLLLTVTTIISWWASSGIITSISRNVAVTVFVLLMAGLKVHFIMRYFMNVRGAPDWLGKILVIWLVVLEVILIIVYAFFGIAPK